MSSSPEHPTLLSLIHVCGKIHAFAFTLRIQMDTGFQKFLETLYYLLTNSAKSDQIAGIGFCRAPFITNKDSQSTVTVYGNDLHFF